MRIKRPERMYVDPEFKKKIQQEAIERQTSVIDHTRHLARRRKKNELF